MKLYKFIGCKNLQWTKEILKTGKFHFSLFHKLNDPMEGFFLYYPDEHARTDIEKLVGEKGNHRICSFSKNYEEILMWTHYANNHKGICIEIDTDIELDTDAEQANGVSLKAIKYGTRISTLKRKNGTSLTAKELLSKKIRRWQHETEVRAFHVGKDDKLEVGRITRVLLGLRTEDGIKNLVQSCVDYSIAVAQTQLNFDTNKIELK